MPRRTNMTTRACRAWQRSLADPAAVQLAWINQTMAASTADCAHHIGHCESPQGSPPVDISSHRLAHLQTPVWSIAEHGPTAYLVTNLKPLLELYGAAFVHQRPRPQPAAPQ